MLTQKDETRARLFDAARRLLVERGFHGVKLEDIAEEAGISRQAFYKSHFASKAELLLALGQHLHAAEKLDELIEPYLAARSGVEMLREAIRSVVLIEGRIHDIALALTAAASSDAGARAAQRDRLEVKRGALRAAVLRVRTDGHLHPDWPVEEVVELVLALVSVDTYELLVVQAGWSPERLIERATQLCETFLVRRRRRS